MAATDAPAAGRPLPPPPTPQRPPGAPTVQTVTTTPPFSVSDALYRGAIA
ncbi:MAG: hypothetical protein M3276_08680 [Actinomycetota bacterium]|nr:hypothetical protein [Actinomycetota bacterium]